MIAAAPRPRAHRRLRLLALVTMAALLSLAGLSGAVWAASYSGKAGSVGNEMVAAADWVAPTASSSLIDKSQGGVPGYIHQGGGYNAYANVSDGGAPASGVASVTGALSTITTGQAAAALTAGAFTIGATTYNYRSAGLTANATLTAGTYSYSLTSKDLVANSRVQAGFTVIVDNTAPTAADIQTENKSGNTVGIPEIGDSVIYTFSEPIDPISILAGWSGAATSVVARITNTVNDPFTVFNAANTTQLPLGSINLGRNDYVTASATFGATGIASTMVLSGNTITVTLGTASTGPATTANTGTMIWSPSGSAFDRAANAEGTATRSETGAADKEF
jgi:hypothetical protein